MASYAIVLSPGEFFRDRQQLRNYRQNLWRANQISEGNAKLHIRVVFVCPSCPLYIHRFDFGLSSRDHRWHRAGFVSRGRHEGDTKLSEGLRKATRRRVVKDIAMPYKAVQQMVTNV